MRAPVAATLVTLPLAWQLCAAEAPDPIAVAALEKFLARPPIAHSYCAFRRLDASGGGQRGWVEVQTGFTPAGGLAYEVTAEGGSGYIRKRVLRSLLDEEQRLLGMKSTSAALSLANYRFQPGAMSDEGLAVVTLEPLRKDRSLIVGRMLLTRDDGQLVRLEGRLAKNPSFWVTRVDVVRSYRAVNGVFLPVSLETTAQLRLLGSSKLAMSYRYSEVDDRAVRPDDAGAADSAEDTFDNTPSSSGVMIRSCRARMTASQSGSNFFHPAA
jgi:hypothetical protein